MDPVAPVVPAAPAAAAPAPAAAAPAPVAAAAPTPTTGTDILRSMTETQRADYQRTGDLPADLKPTFAEDSSPSKPAEQVAETAASKEPVSETGDPKRPDPRATENRVPELLKKHADDRAAWEREKRELLARTAPAQTTHAAPSPAPEPKPDGTDYTKYPLGTSDPNYIEDLAGWKAQSLLAADRKSVADAAAKASAHADAQRIAQDWQRRVEAVKAKHADVIETFSEPIAIPQGSAADLWVLESDMGPETLYHLYAHPEEVTRITALSPLKQIEAMVLLGLSLTDAAPPIKTKTDAPAPVPTLDTRPAAAGNDADAALARGDFAAYARIQNERDLAASSAGRSRK